MWGRRTGYGSGGPEWDVVVRPQKGGEAGGAMFFLFLQVNKVIVVLSGAIDGDRR